MSQIKAKDDEIEVKCICPKCNMKIVHKIFEQEGKNICEDYFEPITEPIKNEKETENENTEKRSTKHEIESNSEASGSGVGIREIYDTGGAEQSDWFGGDTRNTGPKRKIIGIF